LQRAAHLLRQAAAEVEAEATSRFFPGKPVGASRKPLEDPSLVGSLITERRQGTHRYYKADRRALGPLEVVLRQMWARDLGRLRQLAEEEAGRKRHD
jgi:hypothetical protein